MATYHLRVKTISRGQGQSVVAAAAYRSGERLADDASGRVRHYADRAGRVRFAGLFLPFGAPAWAHSRTRLWNEVERVERRRDATLAREIELSLPHELTDRQRLQLVRDFVREHLVRRGLAVDVAIHVPDRGGDPRNFHAHLLIAERQLGPRGFAARKDRGLQSKATLHGWRSGWAKLCNRYLAAHGHAARVDHRSFRARGIKGREPTVPLGPVVTAMQRRGVVTPRVRQLAAVQARNALRQGWREAGTVGRRAVMPLPVAAVATAHRSAVSGGGDRPAASGMVVRARMLAALASLAAVAPERSVREVAREVCRGAESGAVPVQPFSALPIERPDTSYEDAQLAVMLASIADEVQACTVLLCATIAADFAGRVDLARRTLPRDHVAAAVAALKQANREAVKLAKQNAVKEISVRQRLSKSNFQQCRRKAITRYPTDPC